MERCKECENYKVTVFHRQVLSTASIGKKAIQKEGVSIKKEALHDLYSSTAEASKTIIPELIKRGYQLVTVEELAQYRGGMETGKRYSSFRPD